MTAAPSLGPETRVVVTADDLGWESSGNRAILDSLAAGTITHTSLMTNFSGLDEACALAHERGLADRIGIHINLSDGRPLTEAMRASSRFCREGEFRFPLRYDWMRPLSRDDRRAVAGEARAQIASARAHGMPLSHLDSHHHVHCEPHLARVLGAVAKEAGIARVRPARNCGRTHGLVRVLKSRWYNGWLAKQGLRGVRYFGGVGDIEWLRPEGAGFSLEIMVHPTFDPQGVIVDGPTGVPLRDWMERLRAVTARAH